MPLYVNDPDETLSMDITEYFETEHLRINAIFNELLQDPNARWGNKVSQLRMIVGDLIVAEELFLFPKANQYPETKRRVQANEGLQRRIRELLNQMAVLSRNDVKWIQGVKELQTALSQYFEDEESNLFPAIRRLLPNAERIELRGRIRAGQVPLRAAV